MVELEKLKSERDEIQKMLLRAERELETQRANTLNLTKQVSQLSSQVQYWSDAYNELHAKLKRQTVALSNFITLTIDSSKMIVEQMVPGHRGKEIAAKIEELRPVKIS